MSGLSDKSNQTRISGLTLAFMTVTVGVLFFVQLFVTFRGLSSAAGMDQAQVARELARGHGLHTKVVRPYEWRQQIDAGKVAQPGALSDTMNPPLQSLMLAPLFKMFESFWSMDANSSIYFLDRVVAAVGMIFFLGSVAIGWLIARRLFDDTIAGWSVLAVLACQFLWDVARSGLPQMMMLFFFLIALRSLLIGLERVTHNESAVRQALVIGCMGALMVLCHWMGVFLVIGFTLVTAWLLRPRALAAALTGVIPLLVLVAWGARNQVVCGDVFGAVKATMQSVIALSSDTLLLRDFSGKSPMAAADVLAKKLAFNLVAQLRDLYTHLGAVLPAALFFFAILHPFKRRVVRYFGWCVMVLWLFSVLGMALLGLPAKENDANQIHSLFILVMVPYGFAFLAVLWGRLGLQGFRGGWWSRHGLAAAAFAITAMPMLLSMATEVTHGLKHKDQFAQWPPYLPRQINKIASFTQENELVMTDMPWAVAWYADRPGAWLPVEKKDFPEMKKASEERGGGMAGILMSPLSLNAEHLADIFTGEYHDWAAPAMRGILLGFGVDIMTQTDLPCRYFLPLAGQSIEKGFVAEMLFMSDRKRWEPGGGLEPEPGKQADASAPK